MTADRVALTDNPLARVYEPPTTLDGAALLRSGRPVWIAPADPGEAPEVVAYRLRFGIDDEVVARVHVSADERYELWLDGQRIGRGPERGSEQAWCYETYDLPFGPGDHVLVARVWRLGEIGPMAQVSIRPGFLLATAEPFVELLATGVASWEVKRLDGDTFAPPRLPKHFPWFSGPNQTTDTSRSEPDIVLGRGDGWTKVHARIEDLFAFVGDASGHRLHPAMLPAQLAQHRRAGTVRHAAEVEWSDPQHVVVERGGSREDAASAWQALVDDDVPVVVARRSSWQIVLDAGAYVCAYPELVVTGGAGSVVTISWAESLFDDADGVSKGQRDQVDGKHFFGPMCDELRLDGRTHRWSSLWWRAGRFVQLLVRTGDEPLTIGTLSLEETRYPLEMESTLSTDDGRLDAIVPIAMRSLQMCSHETYMDCPYYEQLMYIGDTRLEALTTYAVTHDDRLPRKALRTFDLSRLPSGTTQARAPGRDAQVIAPFSLWWVAMVHDFASWRGDPAFVRTLLPGVRAVIESFLALLDDTGLLAPPPGWNFVDWAAGWVAGNPPDAATGPSGVLNWHLVHTLGLAAELEGWVGEATFADRLTRVRGQLTARVNECFWDDARGLFADDVAHLHFSEHAQCLAVLSGTLADAQLARVGQGLLTDGALTRTTIYFSHYMYEAYRVLGLADAMFTRLQLWFDLAAQGFTTTPEAPEPTRSDCHGWGAHPLFHGVATVLGVRPASWGFARVDVSPLLGPLRRISGSLVHPAGRIEVQLERHGSRLVGNVTLPAGVVGTLRYGGSSLELVEGPQHVEL